MEINATTEGEVAFDPSALPVNECLETSWLSQDQWKNSLRNGCLNKSCNDKLIVFCHLKSLTTTSNLPLKSLVEKQLGVGDIEQAASVGIPEKETGTTNTDIGTSASGSVSNLIFPPFSKSHVIIEDISKPPSETQNVFTLFFTADEFFSFMSEPESGRPKMLRVVGGQLLRRLVTALYALEAKCAISSHEAMAYLNNGHYKQTAGQGRKDSKGIDIPEVLTSHTWINETILVRSVYYNRSREQMSPGEKTRRETRRRMFPYGIPNSHKLFAVDRLKLPPGEDCDPQARIVQLEHEINVLVLREKQEREAAEIALANTKNGKGREKGKGANDEPPEKQPKGGGKSIQEDFEDIAEDPYLVLEGSHISPKDNRVVEEKPKEEPQQRTQDVEAEKEQENEGEEVDKEQKRKNSENSNPSMTSVSQKHTEGDIQDDLIEEDNLESKVEHCSASLSSLSLSSSGILLSMELSSDESEQKKRLYPSGYELYVSGLYSSITENAQATADRLHRANQIKLKQRYQAVKSKHLEFYQSKDIDFSSRFKCLAKIEDSKKSKAMQPKLPVNKTPLCTPVNTTKNISDEWSVYFKGQEEMEMRMATESRFQIGVLKRLADPPVVKETKQDGGRDPKKVKALGRNDNNKNSNSKTGIKTNGKKHRISFVDDLICDSEPRKCREKTKPIRKQSSDTPQHSRNIQSVPTTDPKTRPFKCNYLLGPPAVDRPLNPCFERGFRETKAKLFEEKDGYGRTRMSQAQIVKIQPPSKNERHGKFYKTPPVKCSMNSSHYISKTPPVNCSINSSHYVSKTSNEVEGFQKSSQILTGGNQKSSQILTGGNQKSSQIVTSDVKNSRQSSQPIKRGYKRSSQSLTMEARRSILISAGEARRSRHISAGEARRSSQISTGEARRSRHISAGEARRSSQISMGEARRSSQISTGEDRRSSKISTGETRKSSQISTQDARRSSQTSKAENKQSDGNLTHGTSSSNQMSMSGCETNNGDALPMGVSKAPPKPTESEIIRQDLARFKTACECWECQDDDTILSCLRPNCPELPFTYPLKLGCLKKSFRYLQSLSKKEITPNVYTDVSSLDKGEEWFRDELMTLLDKVVIRKDIMVSSLGKTYTTIVFA